ncbi:hypothetical protein [Streptomyces sp. AM 2-1-1]|uniref:hypothetical protein n=1 Tax=Streptomyces sp. AM 2-1-1 TaxID=3028709 RepID=UPI0023B97B00|nr:hypothetical protein [Streptomyces sp. AM 2-1-1]WEH38305.1 hypothetical protein PZB77_01595 [Streptomyces sp. AM 2-1-1]
MNDIHRERGGKPSDSAADEVLHEIEDTETDDVTGGERSREDGEAADALTPNEEAQEDVRKNS